MVYNSCDEKMTLGDGLELELKLYHERSGGNWREYGQSLRS